MASGVVDGEPEIADHPGMRTLGILALPALLASLGCEDSKLGTLMDALPGPDVPGTALDVGFPPSDSGLPGDAREADAGAADLGLGTDATDSDAGFADAGFVDPDSGVVASDAGFIDPDGGACTDGGVSTSVLNTTATSHIFSGNGPASTTGELVLTSTSGQVLRVPLSTTAGGTYSVEVPLFCGAQSVVITFGAAASCQREELSVLRTGCADADIQVTLSWDDKGRDFELHLIKAGGRINDNATDCTWTSCIGSSPDWGVVGDPGDNPHKDVDNTGTFGPENIYLSRPESTPYTVMVEHWGGGTPDADGSVTILLRGGPQLTIPITDLPSHFTRAIATIDWPTQTITPLTTVTDCTATWSGGCREPIP